MIFRIIVVWLVSCFAATSDADTAEVSQLLQTRIASLKSQPETWVADQCIYASAALHRFYEQRGYRPAWTDEAGFVPEVDALLLAICDARREGLHPENYHLDMIQRMLAAIEGVHGLSRTFDPHLLMELDLLLTDAFLTYGFHLLAVERASTWRVLSLLSR